MSIPTDRGFVLIRTNEDRTHQVEIYTKRPSAGATPFAVYSRVDHIIRQTAAGFVANGGDEVSRQPVEVTWSVADAAVYVVDEAPLPAGLPTVN